MPRRPGLVSLLLLLLAVTAGACRRTPPAREFTLVGQIVAVDRAASQVTVRHQDIKGFMPGMTMPFTVKEPGLLEGRSPGDLIEATLVVQDTSAWISRMKTTGHAPLPAASEPAPGLSPADRVPDQVFTDQDGAPLALDWLDGRVSVVTFIYTRCPLPDFCPAIDRRFVELQRAIRETPGGSPLAGVRLLSVTIDPAFDTPAVLKAHAVRRGADPAIWRFVTGDPAAIVAFGRQFGLDVHQGASGPADLEHNLRTVVLDRDRRVVETLTGAGWRADDLLERLRTVAGA
jgi:protein SCO1/2